jgi:hypothetical protein
MVSVCLGIAPPPPVNFRMPEPNLMKPGILVHIMAPEPISTAYFINLSHQFVCSYVHAHLAARQQPDKKVTAGTNTRNNRSIVGRVIFYAVRVVSKKTRKLILPRTYFSLIKAYSGVATL